MTEEEKKFLAYVKYLESSADDTASPYFVTVNINIRFIRSKSQEATPVKISNAPDAQEVRLTEEQIHEQYPWSYQCLTRECGKRYSDFRVSKGYHRIRKLLVKDQRFGKVRFLDPGNKKSSSKTFYNPNILRELDKHYTQK